MAHEQYQTVKEVAGLLKVSEGTVRRWIKDGELRAIYIGKGWRIAATDLDTFLAGNATRPTTAANGVDEGPEEPDHADAQKARGQQI